MREASRRRPRLPAIRAAIFDLHGTLLDDALLRAGIYRELLLAEGIDLDPGTLAARMAGFDDRTALRNVWAMEGRTLADHDLRRLVAAASARYLEAIEAGVPLHAGARERLLEIAAQLPVAVVARSGREAAAAALKAAGLFGKLIALVTADELRRPSPSPELWERCLAEMDRVLSRYGWGPLSPRQVLAVESSAVGIRAAQAAGLRVAALAHAEPIERLGAAELVVAGFADLDLARALERTR